MSSFLPFEPPLVPVLLTGSVLAVGYCLALAIYRLCFSPLADIPGPRLAALTFLYEAYYDAWLGGQYFRKVEELHSQYGPIVRINPEEVHFNDPHFIDVLYPNSGRKTNKPGFVAIRTGTPDSIVATVDHQLHRQRRNALASFFSGASVRRLEPILRERLQKLLARLEHSGRLSEVLSMHHVFKAYTSDVITEYAFGDSFQFVDAPDYGKAYFDATDYFFSLTHVFGHFPLYARAMQCAPAWLVKRLSPIMRELVEKQTWWIDKVQEIRRSPNPERIKSTIFEGILSSSLPDSEKTDSRLASEAQLVVFAGEGTTAYTLMSAVYEFLSHPLELQKIKAELAAAIPDINDIPTFSQVDGLPYFNAAIQETLRLHPGVMNRQVRISPENPLVYLDKRTGKTYTLPPGTVYSMSPLLTHTNPSIFPHPCEYKPQRWLDDATLSRYFIGFSHGTRSCVGMNLARREMSIVLATLFRRYDVYCGKPGPTLELYDTVKERDIDVHSDKIIPVAAPGSIGLRVKVRQ